MKTNASNRPFASVGMPAVLPAALLLCTLVAGCGAVRLSTPKQIDASLAESAQAHNDRECQRKNADASAYFACRQQNRKSYEQWQKERSDAQP